MLAKAREKVLGGLPQVKLVAGSWTPAASASPTPAFDAVARALS